MYRLHRLFSLALLMFALLNCSDQLQGELSRSAGQQAELQRRLGEAELRVELSGKSAQQEASLTRTELEFSRRKIELLEKDIEAQKQEYERTIKELEQGNIEVNILLSSLVSS